MSTLRKCCAVGITVLAVLLLAGCSKSVTNSSTSNQPEEGTKAAGVPVTARTAFSQMYPAARSWSTDIVLLKISQKDIPGFKNEAGKAVMWEGWFGSPSQHSYRIYTYSAVAVPPTIHKGVSAGLKMSWAGVRQDDMPIDLPMFNTDSDAAYQAAAADAAAWLKKNPDKAVTAFEIGKTYKFQAPVWMVMWGDKKSGFVSLIDANAGKVLKHK